MCQASVTGFAHSGELNVTQLLKSETYVLFFLGQLCWFLGVDCFLFFLCFCYRYVLECPKCGIIYRSREKWYGNEEPNVSAVKSEIRHIWPGVSEIYIKPLVNN